MYEWPDLFEPLYRSATIAVKRCFSLLMIEGTAMYMCHVDLGQLYLPFGSSGS